MSDSARTSTDLACRDGLVEDRRSVIDRDRRLQALVQAGLVLTSELSLPAVLRKIVAGACDVADARYGALGVIGPNGQLADFITDGVSAREHVAIGDLPVGRGLLGALIHEAKPLRLGRIHDDPRSSGFPANHPAMESFLGVPITVRGTVYGNLYLTEKRGLAGFTADDERAVVMLAAQAGVAIENARLFAEVRKGRASEERDRLARDLHDSLSQSLFSITLQTRAAQLSLEESTSNPLEAVAEHLRRLQELTEGALSEMRALIFELRPDAVQEEGLVAAIGKHTESVAARAGLVLSLDLPDYATRYPPEVEEQLYRIARESISNVLKHADATTLHVRLLDSRGTIMLEISDNGNGFEPGTSRPGHLGLRTMAQRADQLGGTFDVQSAPAAGTTVRIRVPLSEPPRTDLTHRKAGG